MNKYSVILPVKNGGEFVKQCVGSILSQTFQDFNIIILDNCSSDGTVEWIESLKQSNIVVFRSPTPLSIEENWARILTVPKNEFITLIGHDDLLAPNFLELMNELIHEHPDASLYTSRFTYIDSAGNKIRTSHALPERMSAPEFLETMLNGTADIMGTGFVMRASDYNRVGGIPPYPNLLFADFELWTNLSYLSYLVVSKNNSFSFRLHKSTTTLAADSKILQAFDQLINYLMALKTRNEDFEKVIKRSVKAFLSKYCQSLCHRLLRTPMKDRNNLTVNTLINKFRDYSEAFGPQTKYEPLTNFTIRLALIIDSNPVTRHLFLFFKKVYPKPVLHKTVGASIPK